jgi:RNA polymerase sigma factor (sigma-70 family)
METAISVDLPVSANSNQVDNHAFQAMIAKDKELRALMRRAQSGSSEAYARVIQAIFPIVSKMIRRHAANAPAADREDLLQDVMMSFHTARATYDPTRPFIPWLKTIVMNRAVDFLRKQKRTPTGQTLSEDLADSVADDTASDVVQRHESIDALRKAISALPKRQRSAIELLKIRELTCREAAAQTGISVSALKASVHRAVGTLRISLAPYEVA